MVLNEQGSEAKRDLDRSIITQREITSYLEGVEACRKHDRLRKDLMKRLADGAEVESGVFSLSIDMEHDHRWSLDAVKAVIGAKDARKLWDQLPLQPIRRLRLRNEKGEYVGWKPSSLMVRTSPRTDSDVMQLDSDSEGQCGSQRNVQ